VKLAFSADAERDAEAIDEWWKANRLDAPLLFRQELAAVCDAVRRKPLVLRRYAIRNSTPVYRWRLARTQQHVYYTVNLEEELVTVLRIWGGRRGRGPKL
jgi:plasmid stabilization system protein ParE